MPLSEVEEAMEPETSSRKMTDPEALTPKKPVEVPEPEVLSESLPARKIVAILSFDLSLLATGSFPLPEALASFGLFFPCLLLFFAIGEVDFFASTAVLEWVPELPAPLSEPRFPCPFPAPEP